MPKARVASKGVDDRSAYRMEDPMLAATGRPIYIASRVLMNEKKHDRVRTTPPKWIRKHVRANTSPAHHDANLTFTKTKFGMQYIDPNPKRIIMFIISISVLVAIWCGSVAILLLLLLLSLSGGSSIMHHWFPTCWPAIMAAALPTADEKPSGPKQYGGGIQGQYVYWVGCSHPKDDTVARFGLTRPCEFTREEFSELIVKAHGDCDIEVLETASFSEITPGPHDTSHLLTACQDTVPLEEGSRAPL